MPDRMYTWDVEIDGRQPLTVQARYPENMKDDVVFLDESGRVFLFINRHRFISALRRD